MILLYCHQLFEICVSNIYSLTVRYNRCLFTFSSDLSIYKKKTQILTFQAAISKLITMNNYAWDIPRTEKKITAVLKYSNKTIQTETPAEPYASYLSIPHMPFLHNYNIVDLSNFGHTDHCLNILTVFYGNLFFVPTYYQIFKYIRSNNCIWMSSGRNE